VGGRTSRTKGCPCRRACTAALDGLASRRGPWDTVPGRNGTFTVVIVDRTVGVVRYGQGAVRLSVT
jgi:hypothetical protein